MTYAAATLGFVLLLPKSIDLYLTKVHYSGAPLRRADVLEVTISKKSITLGGQDFGNFRFAICFG